MSEVPNDKQIGTILDDAITKAFAFPFWADEHCKPDGNKHDIPDRTFHLNGYFVVLHTIRLFPGLTFRALEANTGDLNALTQDVKFEIDIPLIGGYFYVVSEDENDKKQSPIRGTFKIIFDTAIAKGIGNFFLTDNYEIEFTNLVADFELMEKPKVTLYPEEDGQSIGPLESDTAANGAKVAEVLWPSVHSVLHRILQEKIRKVCSEIPRNKYIFSDQFINDEKNKRSKITDLLSEIIAKVKRALREKMKGGRWRMPDIDVMLSPMHTSGSFKFKATSGWLENVASIKINGYAAVHARSKNELVIIGHTKFNDWRHYYDEYTFMSKHSDITGEIINTFDDNEGFIKITAIRTDDGKTVNHGRLEYVYATKADTDVTRHEYHHADWLTCYVPHWMSGLMEAEKSALNKIISDYLNEFLVDVDFFAYWEELNNTRSASVPS